ncbi:hypothetical protein SprV_0401546700 [Sparganum proliferum]
MALDCVLPKLIAVIKAYYCLTTARVLVLNNLSQQFGIRSDVRQGCILKPSLFNYAIRWIRWKALHEVDGVEFAPGHRLTDLDYADDIALLASSFGDLQSMMSGFGIRSDVRQGCILKPSLFNYAIRWIRWKALHEVDGVEFAPGHRLTDLDYADDIALLASSFGDLQSMMSGVNEVAKSVG